MSQPRKNYFDSFEQEEQRSFEFTEYPELHSYYTSKMKSPKKPTKIILTEIYSPTETHIQSYNYFTQSKSYKNIKSNKDEIYPYNNKKEYIDDNNFRYDKNPSHVNIQKRIYSFGGRADGDGR